MRRTTLASLVLVQLLVLFTLIWAEPVRKKEKESVFLFYDEAHACAFPNSTLPKSSLLFDFKPCSQEMFYVIPFRSSGCNVKSFKFGSVPQAYVAMYFLSLCMVAKDLESFEKVRAEIISADLPENDIQVFKGGLAIFLANIYKADTEFAFMSLRSFIGHENITEGLYEAALSVPFDYENVRSMIVKLGDAQESAPITLSLTPDGDDDVLVRPSEKDASGNPLSTIEMESNLETARRSLSALTLENLAQVNEGSLSGDSHLGTNHGSASDSSSTRSSLLLMIGALVGVLVIL